ncbi:MULTISPECIES: DUF2975 domain-containing protein [Agrobacterium]|uniref:DUF2975 domain-containing protein n=1 Tax=Agrobacterium TaxID=357 RepID=UPI00098FD0C7|nr:MULTISPECIES: DUF2975 domain-containing protein [Agrobacterium]OOO35790.1 DUF2975 domain-containing protein [Agrobacterium sp. YIC 4121]CUX21200.1 conserved membrane hypothetical protein [Agrobacterium deltaense RV3]
MTDPSVSRRIGRVSRILIWLAFLLAGLLVAGYAAIWADAETLRTVIEDQILPPATPYRLTDLVRVTGFIIGLLPLVAALCALWFAIHLFRLFERGEVFMPASGKAIIHIGVALVAILPAQIIMTGFASFLLTMGNPVPSISFSFESTQMLVGFAGGLMIVVGWVLGEATRIADENREFI